MSESIIRGTKDPCIARPDWRAISDPFIHGVVAHDLKPIQLADGALCELLRLEWLAAGASVGHVFQRTYTPGAISAWHVHEQSTDRMCSVAGDFVLAFYDGRAASPTAGRVSEYRIGTQRPCLLVIPPGVWHGLKNVGIETALLINMSDKAYRYDDPDHRRLPADCPEIPYKFT
jgi:dTDP-4-dehydrorhamnose 3,5-epimerase